MQPTPLSDLDVALEGNGPRDAPKHPVVCLHHTEEADSWFSEQLGDLAVRAWGGGTPPVNVQSGRDWAETAGLALQQGNESAVHVIATGPAVLGAIALAADHPELVLSLILGDPEVDPADQAYSDILATVQAPTLVIAAAPTFTTDISRPQSVAGGIRNGVFVIIDNCHVPAHRNRPGSFNEWAKSFINIAEGLHAFGRPEKDGNVRTVS